jgi:hypothetical protein
MDCFVAVAPRNDETFVIPGRDEVASPESINHDREYGFPDVQLHI